MRHETKQAVKQKKPEVRRYNAQQNEVRFCWWASAFVPLTPFTDDIGPFRGYNALFSDPEAAKRWATERAKKGFPDPHGVRNLAMEVSVEYWKDWTRVHKSYQVDRPFEP